MDDRNFAQDLLEDIPRRNSVIDKLVDILNETVPFFFRLHVGAGRFRRSGSRTVCIGLFRFALRRHSADHARDPLGLRRLVCERKHQEGRDNERCKPGRKVCHEGAQTGWREKGYRGMHFSPVRVEVIVVASVKHGSAIF